MELIYRMGLFNFFRKKQAPTAADTKTETVNRIELSPELSLYKNLIEKTAVPYIRIKAEHSDDLSILDSKFAGTPYWPAGTDYPTDAEGHPMLLLAQLNFSEIPRLPDYPDGGLLQFFISVTDDVYGVNFNDLTDQSNFRIVYHETIDEACAEKDFAFLADADKTVMPVYFPMRLSFSLDADYVGTGDDVQFRKHFGTDLYSFAKQFGEKSDEIGQELCDKFSNDGHKIGGYAYFTQDGPRSYKTAFNDWILLLQIDSEGRDIVWGDMGVGNFFIHPDALKRKDFSKVMYTWDCC